MRIFERSSKRKGDIRYISLGMIRVAYRLRRFAIMSIGSGYMFRSNGTFDVTYESRSDGHLDRFMGCGSVISGFRDTATKPYEFRKFIIYAQIWVSTLSIL